MIAFVTKFMEQCIVIGKTVLSFATNGMMGIIKQGYKCENILMLFESGVFKKGDYTK